MKSIKCEGCGSGEFYEEGGYRVCKYCGRKYIKTQDDIPVKESNIDLSEDVQALLDKWDSDPANGTKYADLILQIDPYNKRALDYKNTNTSGGCYIATSVYGSYDCPQVWTLRRFRDHKLAETLYGRAFIYFYYAVSPSLVQWFGHTKWFKAIWKRRLDRLVTKLQSEGIEATPYKDRKW